MGKRMTKKEVDRQTYKRVGFAFSGPHGLDGKPAVFEAPLKHTCKQCGRKYGSNACPNCGIGPA